MKRTLLALLVLLAGCRPPCRDQVFVVGPASREPATIWCDRRASMSIQETDHGLMVLCTCPTEPHL